MAGFNIFAAETREEAELIATSQMQAFVALRTGTPGRLKPPVEGYRESLPMQAQAMLAHVQQCSSIGTQEDVEHDLAAFIRRTRVDEVIVSSMIYDTEARKRSFEIAMAAAKASAVPAPAS